jgi:hypothetical protein
MAVSGTGNARRAGLPPKSSVIAEGALTPPGAASAGAPGEPTLSKTYRILRTNEVDPTDAAVRDEDIAYDPPIPIEVEGSLFFDMSHANGQGPGPATLRKDIPTIWEIHPVSKILFEP